MTGRVVWGRLDVVRMMGWGGSRPIGMEDMRRMTTRWWMRALGWVGPATARGTTLQALLPPWLGRSCGVFLRARPHG